MAGVVQSHSFEQGNKRTGFVAMVQFLMENGFDVTIEDTRLWAEEVIGLIEHRLQRNTSPPGSVPSSSSAPEQTPCIVQRPRVGSAPMRQMSLLVARFYYRRYSSAA
ncbi:MAG: hypothetical protein WB697_15625 [Stellaceae bacterium]